MKHFTKIFTSCTRSTATDRRRAEQQTPLSSTVPTTAAAPLATHIRAEHTTPRNTNTIPSVHYKCPFSWNATCTLDLPTILRELNNQMDALKSHMEMFKIWQLLTECSIDDKIVSAEASTMSKIAETDKQLNDANEIQMLLAELENLKHSKSNLSEKEEIEQRNKSIENLEQEISSKVLLFNPIDPFTKKNYASVQFTNDHKTFTVEQKINELNEQQEKIKYSMEDQLQLIDTKISMLKKLQEWHQTINALEVKKTQSCSIDEITEINRQQKDLQEQIEARILFFQLQRLI